MAGVPSQTGERRGEAPGGVVTDSPNRPTYLRFWVVGPAGLEPGTCGLRVWCEDAGQSAVRPLSWAFASQWCPSFLVVARSFTGTRRGQASLRRCHFDHTGAEVRRGVQHRSCSLPEVGGLCRRLLAGGSGADHDEIEPGRPSRPRYGLVAVSITRKWTLGWDLPGSASMPRSRYRAVVAGLSRQEVADRAGVPLEQVGRLVDLGFVHPGEGSFSAGDVRRARLVHALERSGVPIDAMATAVEGGDLSFAVLDLPLYKRFSQLTDRTFEGVSDQHGIPLELLKVVREAIGFARPSGEDLVREDELLVVPSSSPSCRRGSIRRSSRAGSASSGRACAGSPRPQIS